ncbi:Exodeoxyribonuclease VII small subunit [Carboxydocella sporoproducens DSM 16521]|uniref:Exodeoxyribonuclease 7 small subunit n=2 Tax=Carboxydocella TaxID=178898 RepID=A0A1T4NW64_9FIRM|nr:MULTISPECIES: exodeoxyribonuclease VII small subunit [Carboxydocella]AVX20153.1 Exodeoxyribonuclease VII small subunit [Carboxydocella thermautotrophica]GAW28432.1 exodeoxyribonuclease VII small subunit [Carboxydocella sp. ULO1]SJZ83463.1 Exodeoxyribonuclease VII small subunit [Carboxydocella sporoproducens DSM 16521]
MDNQLSYEEAMQKLERIVSQLERGQLPLEDALRAFEEGVKLVRLCQEKLQAAEGKLLLLQAQSNAKIELQEATLE